MKGTKKNIFFCMAMFLSVLVFSQPTFTVSVKQYAFSCDLAAASVHVQGGVPPYQYQWSHGAIGDTVSSLGAGNYSITITDNNTPANDTTVYFTIDPIVCDIGVSIVFTPNGDGNEDTWGISNIDHYPEFSLAVYDRWGQLVHQQKKKYISWDGKQLGVNLPEATYYYIFFYKESVPKNYKTGSVTIVR